MTDILAIKNYLCHLQQRIVSALEDIDSQSFLEHPWQRPDGGQGLVRFVEEGSIFERGGVCFSHVMGHHLPPAATASRPEIAGSAWEAMGVSLILHPRNPYIPTVHMNVRFFIARPMNQEAVWWFGGGMDLTPYYGFIEDVQHFHRSCRKALAPFGPELYPRFKQGCDDYFYLKHRQEPRGVGGIVFDDFNVLPFAQSFAMMRSVGDHFSDAYLPILQRRHHHTYGERERDFQAYRRGRYVEFNLLYDRGTLFGIQAGGGIENVLLSMPPLVRWRYNWRPEEQSPEASLYSDFLVHKDWLT